MIINTLTSTLLVLISQLELTSIEVACKLFFFHTSVHILIANVYIILIIICNLQGEIHFHALLQFNQNRPSPHYQQTYMQMSFCVSLSIYFTKQKQYVCCRWQSQRPRPTQNQKITSKQKLVYPSVWGINENKLFSAVTADRDCVQQANTKEQTFTQTPNLINRKSTLCPHHTVWLTGEL